MAASTLGMLIWSFRMPRNRRVFHYLFTAVMAISTVSWYSQASDLGATPITTQFLHHSARGSGFAGYPTRQIWYGRYVDWTLTTTLLLLSLLLITGLPLSVIFITLFFNVLMVVCGLLGALTRTRYKWGYFVSASRPMFLLSVFDSWHSMLTLLALRSFVLCDRSSRALRSATSCITSLHPVYAPLDASAMGLAVPF